MAANQALKIIPQRHQADCAVACLAMLCEVSYEEALMAFRHNVCMYGCSLRRLIAAAARLGDVLVNRKVRDLDTDMGILLVGSTLPSWTMNHLVILKDGQIVDTDLTLWDADVFMTAYQAHPISILQLKEGAE